MVEITIFGTALIGSALGLWLFRRFGAGFGRLDVPNERSSHSTPTLRGGGLVIVALGLGAYLIIGAAGFGRLNPGYLAGSILIAVFSWMDDRWGLAIRTKFVIHAASALLLVAFAGPQTSAYVPFLGPVVLPEWVGCALSLIWVAWIITVFNFMDGLDGLAGSQAVNAGIAWAALAFIFQDAALYLFAGAIAFIGLGFLIHNWSPARVFMGDIGSAFLGFTFAAMPFLALPSKPEAGPWLMTAAVSFLFVFALDMSMTFVRRLFRGVPRPWSPHREHVYQRLVISGWSHSRVALFYIVIGSIVNITLILAVRNDGIADVLLVFVYLTVAATMLFLAAVKKV